MLHGRRSDVESKLKISPSALTYKNVQNYASFDSTHVVCDNS